MLKSIYIIAYIVLSVTVAVSAVDQLIATRNVLSWGGVLLAYVPFLAVLAWVTVLQSTPRTSARFPTLIVLAVVGVLASTWGYVNGGSLAAALLAGGGLVAFLIYDYWYSSFGDRSNDTLAAGQSLPDFELKNTAGETISSAVFTDKPCVWIFYRGNWCPLCMAQVKEIAAQYNEIEKLGVRVALVSPQPHKNTKSLAKRFDVNFDFLIDEDNQAARQLGIAHSFGVPMGVQALGYDSETVMPTVIITDKGGRILWLDETDNYRVRPNPETYLGVLQSSN